MDFLYKNSKLLFAGCVQFIAMFIVGVAIAYAIAYGATLPLPW